MVDLCFTSCVHYCNLKRNKAHSISTTTTTDAVVQEGDKMPSYFPHKWAPDNCNIYVACVKGKALWDTCVPWRIDAHAAQT